MTTTVITLLLLTSLLRGETPLQHDAELTKRANERAEYLCTHKLAHTGYEKSFAGIEATIIGENLAKGFKTPQKAFVGWVNSPSHKANMLNTRYTHIGIGEAKCKNKTILVQFFKG